jgi:DHA2 family multidrug resistance protein
LSRETRIDWLGILLLVIRVGSLQLSLERSIGKEWPPSLEITVEVSIAVLALSAIAVRSIRRQFSLFRFEVFRNVNFAISVFYNFMVGALVLQRSSFYRH